jgi:hypothetical protein
LIVRLGIDAAFPIIYEGFGNYFRTMSSEPLVSDVILDPELPISGVGRVRPSAAIFREDDFDLTARVRRGRLYQLAKLSQPSSQCVFRRLAGEVTDGSDGKSIFVYESYQLTQNAAAPRLLALGSRIHFGK